MSAVQSSLLLTAGLSSDQLLCSIGSIIKDIETERRAAITPHTVTLTCFIAPELNDILLGNPEPLRSGISALLANAHQLTSSGRIHIHATAQPALTPEHRPVITLIIADTGAGIAPASLGALFQEGRALAPIQSWAKAHKGNLDVISNLGRGSEFTLTFEAPAFGHNAADETETQEEDMPHYLPIDLGFENHGKHQEPASIINEQPLSEADLSTETASLNGARILIVEDIASNQDIIKLLLRDEDCHFICASNGPQALEILRTQSVDFILMDVLMSGIETIHTLRQSGTAYAHTPIIALTADANPTNNAACLAAGANIFLNKPVLAKNLIEALKFLKRSHSASAYKMERRVIAA